MLPKFNFTYNRKWTDEHNYNVLETEFESGKKQYREKSPSPLKFVLTFEKHNMADNEPQDILDFYDDRKGKLKPFLFDYIHSNGTVEEMTVRFDTNSLSRDITLNTIYRFSIPFVEVL